MSSIFREKSAVVRDAWLDYLKAQEQTGYDAINDESDRLCEVQCNRESDLIVRPAPQCFRAVVEARTPVRAGGRTYW